MLSVETGLLLVSFRHSRKHDESSGWLDSSPGKGAIACFVFVGLLVQCLAGSLRLQLCVDTTSQGCK